MGSRRAEGGGSPGWQVGWGWVAVASGVDAGGSARAWGVGPGWTWRVGGKGRGLGGDVR